MEYVVSQDINAGIKYVLGRVDEDFKYTVYINCTLPTRLYDAVFNGNYNFSHSDTQMKQFNYHKMNNLKDLKEFLETGPEEKTMIVEGFSDIVKLTTMEYARLNVLVVDVLMIMKTRFITCFVLDNKYNPFVDLNCDSHVDV
ncbi:hypothetical protein PSN45_004645 [Yamadazyma tenuis]|nr:uncharacterized protein CANTEDRAFT_114398 [Yamadazyma tenuis ATCC 10573]EGV63541.1 hypothetical protein CANTEDRAFT_114398 [Yamadazyma tenuis ATCC 10573]WEJ97097.1 hypothetical protein PSN45_004645 [Yamadazyma tenuis]